MERIVTPEVRLHARPASEFVQTATEFECELSIAPACDDRDPVNARSMLAVSGLGIESGEDVRIVADGDDAEVALDALEEVLSTQEDGT